MVGTDVVVTVTLVAGAGVAMVALWMVRAEEAAGEVLDEGMDAVQALPPRKRATLG
jgi:hypothetical protein